jgi:hypothetical protein
MTHIIGKLHEPDWQWQVTTPVLVEIVDSETGETVLDPDTGEPLTEPQLDVNGDPVMEPWRPPGLPAEAPWPPPNAELFCHCDHLHHIASWLEDTPESEHHKWYDGERCPICDRRYTAI